MQSLIDANTRVLLFGHGDDMGSCDSSQCPDGLLYTWDHFHQTDVDNLSTCEATLSGDVQSGFLLMNHFGSNSVNLPSESRARFLNSYETLEERFAKCSGRRQPTFLAVDFWDVGDVLKFVMNENEKKNRLNGEDNSDEAEKTQVNETVEAQARNHAV